MIRSRVLEAGFADADGLVPIGGEVTDDIEALDRLLLIVAKRVRAIDAAPDVGMWRTWMLHALGEAERQARAAAARALRTLPLGNGELRDAVQRRCAGLDRLVAKYPGRVGLL